MKEDLHTLRCEHCWRIDRKGRAWSLKWEMFFDFLRKLLIEFDGWSFSRNKFSIRYLNTLYRTSPPPISCWVARQRIPSFLFLSHVTSSQQISHVTFRHKTKLNKFHFLTFFPPFQLEPFCFILLLIHFPFFSPAPAQLKLNPFPFAPFTERWGLELWKGKKRLSYLWV